MTTTSRWAGGRYTLSAADAARWADEDPGGAALRARVRAECTATLSNDPAVFAIEIRDAGGRLIEVVDRRGAWPRRRAKRARPSAPPR